MKASQVLNITQINSGNVQEIYTRNFKRFIYINSENVSIDGKPILEEADRQLLLFPGGIDIKSKVECCGTKDGFKITESDFIKFEQKKYENVDVRTFKYRKQLELYSTFLSERAKELNLLNTATVSSWDLFEVQFQRAISEGFVIIDKSEAYEVIKGQFLSAHNIYFNEWLNKTERLKERTEEAFNKVCTYENFLLYLRYYDKWQRLFCLHSGNYELDWEYLELIWFITRGNSSYRAFPMPPNKDIIPLFWETVNTERHSENSLAKIKLFIKQHPEHSKSILKQIDIHLETFLNDFKNEKNKTILDKVIPCLIKVIEMVADTLEPNQKNISKQKNPDNLFPNIKPDKRQEAADIIREFIEREGLNKSKSNPLAPFYYALFCEAGFNNEKVIPSVVARCLAEYNITTVKQQALSYAKRNHTWLAYQTIAKKIAVEISMKFS